MSLKALKKYVMLCFEFWLLFPSLFCCSSSCSACLTAAQTGKVARKKKKPFFHILNLQRGTCPVKNEAHFQAATCIFPPAKKNGGRREKEQYLTHREDITKPQPHKSHGGTFQTRIEVQGDVFIHTPSSSDSGNYAQAHTVQTIQAPSRNNLHPREREEIFVSPWAQLLD